ncbi:ABC transporter permease [Dactylosporangium sp. NPDC049525]|uniref:ABC transporter permease n=1 Tax=Dactylosporangium sp. NPDC049525 TaxID=3154730 RepID=UPI0034181082
MTAVNPSAPDAGTDPAAAGREVVFAAKPLDLRAMSRRYRRTQYVNLAMPLLLLVVWQVLVETGVLDQRFFSAPTSIVRTLWALGGSGELWTAIGATGRRVLVGFVLGALVGGLVGVAAARVWIVRALVNPVVAATYPIPKIALLPVLLLIFGTGDTSIYLVVAVSVAYVVLMNTVAGVSNIPAIYQDVARTLQVRGHRYLRTIAIPGALPVIFASLRTSWGIALVIDVAAEFTNSDTGLGRMILSAWQVFDIDTMYAGLVITGLLGWLSFLVIDGIERLVIPWRRGLDG